MLVAKCSNRYLSFPGAVQALKLKMLSFRDSNQLFSYCNRIYVHFKPKGSLEVQMQAV